MLIRPFRAVAFAGMVVSLASGFASGGQEPRPTAPTPERFVVFEDRSGGGRTPRPECLSGYVRRSHPLYYRYHLLILERPIHTAAEPVADPGRCLGADWMKVPSDSSLTALSVATDEILLRFKPGVAAREIDALFREHALTVDEPAAGSRTLTAKTHRPISESLAIVKKLQTSSLVDYAEPNKLVIRFER